MKLNIKSSFLLGFLVCMLLFWVGMYYSGVKNLYINKFWGLSIDFLALFGGIFGIVVARQWGALKSFVGKGIFFLSLGITTWAIGNFIFSYYVFFLNTNIPYPSVADIFFVGALPLWTTGMIYLAKATGAQYGLKRNLGRLYLFLLPIVIFVLSYYLLIVVARNGSVTLFGGGILKTFFDFAYPVGDIVILTAALLIYGLSFKYLGGEFRLPVIIVLIGFLFMFIADFSFSYTTTLGTYYGGSPIDLLFAAAMFAMGFGLSSMDRKN